MAIKIEKLSVTIKSELTFYSKEVVKAVNAETKKAANHMKEETYNTAPANTPGNYRDHIAVKKKSTDAYGNEEYLWYVKAPEYRVSHFINNGFPQRDGKFHEGTHFIDKAADKVGKEFEKNVEEAVKNA